MTENLQSLWLEFDGLYLCVRSPDASHLQWLEEFLVPHFQPGVSHPDYVEIELVLDAALFDSYRKNLPPVSMVPAFALDSDIVQLPLRTSDSENLILFDDHFGVFYDLLENRRKVTILAEKNKSSVRSAFMRVSREYAMNHSQVRGDFYLHASCFLHGGKSMVVTGPKSAGKTTLLAFACLHGGCEYLANDRVLVRREGEHYTLKGMPSIVSVREGTREFFPGIGRRIEEEGLHFRLNSSERRGNSASPDGRSHEGRCMISPLQFVSLLKTRQVSEAQDPVIVIPSITGREGTFTLRDISSEEAVERLMDSIFGARHWVTSTPMFNLRGNLEKSDHNWWQEKCRNFSDRLRCVELEIGLNLYDREENAKDLISALLAEGGPSP